MLLELEMRQIWSLSFPMSLLAPPTRENRLELARMAKAERIEPLEICPEAGAGMVR